MALSLSKITGGNISVTLIPDSGIYAIMSRVNKVRQSILREKIIIWQFSFVSEVLLVSWKFFCTFLFDSLFLIYFFLHISTLIFSNSCLYDCFFIIAYSFVDKSSPWRSPWLIFSPLLYLLPTSCSLTCSLPSLIHISLISSQLLSIWFHSSPFHFTPLHSNSLLSTSSPLLTLYSPPFISITPSLFSPFFLSFLFPKGPCISSRCRCWWWRSMSLRQSYGCYSRKGPYVRTRTSTFYFYRFKHLFIIILKYKLFEI